MLQQIVTSFLKPFIFRYLCGEIIKVTGKGEVELLLVNSSDSSTMYTIQFLSDEIFNDNIYFIYFYWGQLF